MKDLSNENVIHICKNGIQYIQFRKLLEYKDILNHAYSLGVDRNYRTARAKNATPLSEKEKRQTIKDYEELCKAIGTDYINVVKTIQTHTKNIKNVQNKINKGEPDFHVQEYADTDGLITDKKGLVLSTTNADCILLLFFDPVKRVIANVHSGWRGTLQKISVEAVRKMQKDYGSEPKNIICCICPSIRKCHFEVREDVQKPFYDEFKNLKKIDVLIEKIPNTDKRLIDTIEINRLILEQEGLEKENIIDSGICSVCNSDLIHSYRAEKEKYGLNTALIELK